VGHYSVEGLPQPGVAQTYYILFSFYSSIIILLFKHNKNIKNQPIIFLLNFYKITRYYKVY